MDEQPELKLQRIRPGSIIWDPRPDISAIELALALKILLALNQPFNDHNGITAATLSNMPDAIKRHFIYKVEP